VGKARFAGLSHMEERRGGVLPDLQRVVKLFGACGRAGSSSGLAPGHRVFSDVCGGTAAFGRVGRDSGRVKRMAV